MNVEDKVVIVTGAAGGIGRCLVSEAISRGARVVAADQDAVALRELGSEIGSNGMLQACDVSDEMSLFALRESVINQFGHVDVLINNAGVTVLGRFEQLSSDDIQRQLSVNLGAVVESTRLFLPDLSSRPEAHIVQIASMAAMFGMPYQSVYCSTKAAVRAFAQALRAELSNLNIGVTVVLPGATKSGILRNAPTHEPDLTDALPGMLADHGAPPEKLARRVLRAVEKNRAEVRFGFDSHLLEWATRISPGLVRWSMNRIATRAENRRLQLKQSI